MIFRKMFFCGLLGVLWLICVAMREPFQMEMLAYHHALNKINLEHLQYLGAVITELEAVGFVQDKNGRIISLRLHQKLDGCYEVLDVNTTRIVLAAGDHFEIIKYGS